MSELSSITFGCQTYAWQMSGATYRGRLEQMAAVVAEAGFAGIEPEVVMLGEYEDPGRAAEVLERAQLQLAAIAFAAPWREAHETAAERADADRVIELVRRFPGAKLVLVQLPGTDRADLAERRRNALNAINAVGRRALEAGLAPSVHPNSPPGSVFRTAEDYEILVEGLDEAIGFTPDVGHIAAGGMDPLETIRRYRGRVDHVHFKDVATDGRWARTGEGVIDFPGIVDDLLASGYRGWIVFEDESDTAERDPDEAARANGVYAREILMPLVGAAS